MTKNLFAWTGATPKEGYPAFVSINRDAKHVYSIHVRTEGQPNGVQVTIPVEQLEALGMALLADLYNEQARAEYHAEPDYPMQLAP